MTTDAPYDVDARRATPLARHLVKEIADAGPITVDSYIKRCLYDPEHGYYVRQPVLGSASDFITAPEISQIFGELIGVWCVVTWQQLGSPSRLNLIELGPGRGTMMSDALRAMNKAAGLKQALQIHLVETNAVLRQEQEARLAGSGASIHWHRSMDALLTASDGPDGVDGPCLVLGNEFLDAIGVAQWIWRQDGWRERTVERGADGHLRFGVGAEITEVVEPAAFLANRHDGDIREFNPALKTSVVPFLQALAEQAELVGLFIDYGHTTSEIGDTLQAVRAHHYEHPLTSPGEADLTAQVDFADFAAQLHGAGLASDGPLTQAEFLGRLGIIQRASRLMAANPSEAPALEAQTLRLMAPNGMGTRFKVIGVRRGDLAPLACLE